MCWPRSPGTRRPVRPAAPASDPVEHRSSSLCRSESCAAARPERCWAHWSPAFSTRTATRIPCVVRSRWAGSLTTWPAGYGQKRRGGPSPSHWWERRPARWHRTRRPRSQSNISGQRPSTQDRVSGDGGLFVLTSHLCLPPNERLNLLPQTIWQTDRTAAFGAHHLLRRNPWRELPRDSQRPHGVTPPRVSPNRRSCRSKVGTPVTTVNGEDLRLSDDEIFAAHEGGKLGVDVTAPLSDPKSLSIAYTPGVAKVSLAIADDITMARRYTWAHRLVAVVSDGTAVLGLGDIGPAAALPVMEGKSALFK